MITFDLYRPGGTRSKAFFDGPIRAGSLVGMDSAGFRDGFFRDRQTQEMISFVVLPDAGVPRTPQAFEALTFVEAEVGEHSDDGGKVLIRSVSSVGEWARAVWLTSNAGFSTVPEALRPAEAVLAPLREALRSKESVVWSSEEPVVREAPGIAAVCLLKCDSDKRAVVLSDYRSPSYVVRA